MTSVDFKVDVYERIREMNPPKTLDSAAKMAGMQLEFLKPAVMAPTERGLYCGPAAYVSRGHLVMVIADRKKVMTVHFKPLNDTEPCLRELVMYTKAVVPVDKWDEGITAHAAEAALQKWGGKPGKKNPQADQDHTMRVIGAMFACYDDDQLHDFGKLVDGCRELDVCPAFVCLVGPSTSGKKNTLAMAMMMLPLAPYLDAVAV